MIAVIRARLVCLIFGHDIREVSSHGIHAWYCDECGKGGIR